MFIVIAQWLGTERFPASTTALPEEYGTREEAEERANHLQSLLVPDAIMRYSIKEVKTRRAKLLGLCLDCHQRPATFEGRCSDCNEMEMAVEEAEQLHYERWLNGEE